MQVIETGFNGLKILEPKILGDERGYFIESYNKKTLLSLGIDINFLQDNQSSSRKGVLRGLHFQNSPYPQTKLVRVLKGVILDVVVDLRKSSPHFGRWLGHELSAENRHMLWIPPGFGHGFMVLSEYADFLYKATDYYAPEWDRGIRWDDPQIGVTWPLEGQPTLSDKDQRLPFLDSADVYA